MATTQTATISEPGGSPSFAQRVTQIPIVADTISTVHSTLSTNSYSKPIYDRAEGAAQYLYEQSKPLQEKFAGPIGQVDAIANKGLDFVQAKAPFVFETKTDDIVAKARQPADQAYAYGKTYTDAASARLAPITEQFSARLSQSQASIASLQEKLQQAVSALPRDPKSVQDELKKLSEQLVAELEKVTTYVQDKRKELPQQAQAAVSPLVEKLQSTYSDIKAELTKTDVPLSTRATNVLQYSRDQASPLVHEALEALRAIIGKAEKKGNEAADQVQTTVNGST